jgi:glutaminase
MHWSLKYHSKHPFSFEICALNYQQILNEISREVQPLFGHGQVADYIPALKSVDPKKFGIAITTLSGEEMYFGDAKESFSIQSISKVFTLSMAVSAPSPST